MDIKICRYLVTSSPQSGYSQNDERKKVIICYDFMCSVTDTESRTRFYFSFPGKNKSKSEKQTEVPWSLVVLGRCAEPRWRAGSNIRNETKAFIKPENLGAGLFRALTSQIRQLGPVKFLKAEKQLQNWGGGGNQGTWILFSLWRWKGFAWFRKDFLEGTRVGHRIG